MQQLNFQEVIAAALAFWVVLKRWMDALEKISKPLIKEVEAMAQDGAIDRKDRKAIVMKAIALLEERGTIKLNIISRFVISKVVDDVARNLPDFSVSAETKTILADAIKNNVQ